MSEKISLFQRAWGILHFILCLIVVALLGIFLTREIWHDVPAPETPDPTSQIADSPVKIEAPAVTITSGTAVDFNVPAASVVSDAPVGFDVPVVSVDSNAPLDLKVPAISVLSDAPVGFDVPAVSVDSNAPVDLKVPAISIVSDSPVGFYVSSVSVDSNAPIDLKVPAVSVVSDAPVDFNVPAVSVDSNAPVDLKVPVLSVVSDAPVDFKVPSVSVDSNAPVDLKVSAVTVVSESPIVLEVPAVSIISTTPVILEAPEMPDEPLETVEVDDLDDDDVHDAYVAGLKSIAIRRDTPVFQELDFVTVKQTETTEPVVTAIGVDVASLQQSNAGGAADGILGGNKLHEFKFHTPELLTAFTDWQKADDDIAFAEKQLKLVEEHCKTAIDALKRKVDLMEEEVKSGMEAKKSLDEAKSELSQKEFERQKEILAAQATLQHARRDKTKFEKQLELAGFHSELLVSCPRDIDILMAEVSEHIIAHVQVGQKCVARFTNHAEKEFGGQVHSVVPILSNEIRMFRVLFSIDDADDVLHTGMFAEIGLGIDPRIVLQVPPEAVVSFDDSDYVLVRNVDAVTSEDAIFTVTEVRVGELYNSGLEVVSGLEDGDQIVGKGVRLLKPIIADSLWVQ